MQPRVVSARMTTSPGQSDLPGSSNGATQPPSPTPTPTPPPLNGSDAPSGPDSAPPSTPYSSSGCPWRLRVDKNFEVQSTKPKENVGSIPAPSGLEHLSTAGSTSGRSVDGQLVDVMVAVVCDQRVIWDGPLSESLMGRGSPPPTIPPNLAAPSVGYNYIWILFAVRSRRDWDTPIESKNVLFKDKDPFLRQPSTWRWSATERRSWGRQLGPALVRTARAGALIQLAAQSQRSSRRSENLQTVEGKKSPLPTPEAGVEHEGHRHSSEFWGEFGPGAPPLEQVHKDPEKRDETVTDDQGKSISVSVTVEIYKLSE